PGSGYEADDGHFILSYYEFAVDNLLFYHGVTHETFPSIRKGDRRRGDFKVGETFVEVAGFSRGRRSAHTRTYHKKLEEKLCLYAESGIPVIVIYKEDFDNIDVVVSKLRPLIDRHGEEGKTVDITNAIRPVSWWSDWENVRLLLQEVIGDLGHFPVARELEKMGESCISYYIMKFHGGFPEARRRMGAEVSQESPGYFGEWKNVEEMFGPVCKRLRYFPSAKEIRARKHGLLDCVTALYKYWGSIPRIAHALGYPTKQEFDRGIRSVDKQPIQRMDAMTTGGERRKAK
ncbi:MAG: hypothetical protein ABIP48_25245, partial [Planctomycetota bacterium]